MRKGRVGRGRGAGGPGGRARTAAGPRVLVGGLRAAVGSLQRVPECVGDGLRVAVGGVRQARAAVGPRVPAGDLRELECVGGGLWVAGGVQKAPGAPV